MEFTWKVWEGYLFALYFCYFWCYGAGGNEIFLLSRKAVFVWNKKICPSLWPINFKIDWEDIV